jgi:purine-nucleoside phosphorylase
MDVRQQIAATVKAIRSKTRLRPSIGIVLGSGLGYFADAFEERVSIPVATLPHYPKPTITGHSGRIIVGMLHGVPLLAFQGRIHFYESGNLNSVLYPIRVAEALGVTAIIATNAAGGIHPRFTPGDLMLIDDHLNLTFCQIPAVRKHSVPKNSPVYDPALREMIVRCARRYRLPLKRGVYCGLRGPSYETAAEIRMLAELGCDAVGMSTVNETTFAHNLGIRVAAISCITNLSTGISGDKLSHAEVTEVAERVKQTFSDLLSFVIRDFGRKG